MREPRAKIIKTRARFAAAAYVVLIPGGDLLADERERERERRPRSSAVERRPHARSLARGVAASRLQVGSARHPPA